MARDYKHSTRKRQQPKQAPGWLWMLFGLAIGLSVAAVVHFGDRSPQVTQPAPAGSGVDAPSGAAGQEASPASEAPAKTSRGSLQVRPWSWESEHHTSFLAALSKCGRPGS